MMRKAFLIINLVLLVIVVFVLGFSFSAWWFCQRWGGVIINNKCVNVSSLPYCIINPNTLGVGYPNLPRDYFTNTTN